MGRVIVRDRTEDLQVELMAKKLSAKAQQKLDSLQEATRKLDRIHGMVEQYASSKADYYAAMISRAGADLGRVFMNAGLGVMADHAKQMGVLAKRGGATATKFRGLRELVGSLRGELDRATKAVHEAERERPPE